MFGTHQMEQGAASFQMISQNTCGTFIIIHEPGRPIQIERSAFRVGIGCVPVQPVTGIVSYLVPVCQAFCRLKRRIRKAYDCIKQPALVGFYVLADHERLIEGAFFLLCRIVCKKDDRRVREKMRDMHCCPDIYAGAQDLAPKRVTVPVQPGSYFFVDGIDNDFFRH